jgi:hydrogenase expression/formation protein HypC
VCLAVPGKIIETYNAGDLKMGKVDYGGVVKEACLVYVPEADVGQYIIVHAGFALNVLDEAEAQETLALFREMGMEIGGDAETAA